MGEASPQPTVPSAPINSMITTLAVLVPGPRAIVQVWASCRSTCLTFNFTAQTKAEMRRRSNDFAERQTPQTLRRSQELARFAPKASINRKFGSIGGNYRGVPPQFGHSDESGVCN